MDEQFSDFIDDASQAIANAWTKTTGVKLDSDEMVDLHRELVRFFEPKWPFAL